MQDSLDFVLGVILTTAVGWLGLYATFAESVGEHPTIDAEYVGGAR